MQETMYWMGTSHDLDHFFGIMRTFFESADRVILCPNSSKKDFNLINSNFEKAKEMAEKINFKAKRMAEDTIEFHKIKNT